MQHFSHSPDHFTPPTMLTFQAPLSLPLSHPISFPHFISTCTTKTLHPSPPPTPPRRPRPPTPGQPPSTSSTSYLHDVSPFPLLTSSEENRLATRVREFCRLHRAYHQLVQKYRKRSDDNDDSDDGNAVVTDKEWAEEGRVGDVQELRKLWKEGLEARDELVERNLRLVLKIAREIWTSITWWHDSDDRAYGQGSRNGMKEDAIGIGFLDLVQEGNLGLIHAAERFDPDRGVRFSVYAYHHVKSFVQRATAPLGVLIKLPHGVKMAIWKLRKFRRLFYMENGRFPTIEEETKAVPGGEVRKWREYESIVRNFVSIDAAIGKNEDRGVSKTWIDYLVSDLQQPEQWLDEHFARNQLREEMKKFLSEKDVQVLTMRYGLGDEPPMQAVKIATKLGLSWNQVTYICKKAKKILRQRLDEASFVDLLT